MGLSEDLLLMQGHCPFGECLFGSIVAIVCVCAVVEIPLAVMLLV